MLYNITVLISKLFLIIFLSIFANESFFHFFSPFFFEFCLSGTPVPLRAPLRKVPQSTQQDRPFSARLSISSELRVHREHDGNHRVWTSPSPTSPPSLRRVVTPTTSHRSPPESPSPPLYDSGLQPLHRCELMEFRPRLLHTAKTTRATFQ